MSSGTLSQLSSSYTRIIESTLKRVHEAGLLRDVPAGSEVVDELGCRWRVAVERELTAMAARQTERGQHNPKGAGALPALLPRDELGAPAGIARALKDAKPIRPMDGVCFAEEFELPRRPAQSALPAPQRCVGGFSASQVDSQDAPPLMGRAALGSSVGRSASVGPAELAVGGETADETSRKRARTLASAGEKKLAPPSAQNKRAHPNSTPEPAALEQPAASAGSDDEYDGCFEGAEVIVSSTRQLDTAASSDGAVVAAERPTAGDGRSSAQQVPSDLAGDAAADDSSEGSELGSDLDDSEFDFPDIKNTLHVEIKRVNRSKKRWSVLMGRGVLTIDGTECLISSGRGVFDIDAGDTGEGDADAGDT